MIFRSFEMIYITGDTHREQDVAKINPDDRFLQGKEMTEDDYLIIVGDFGFIYDGGKGDKFWLDWIESLPWTTCFIDGNHENFDLLNEFPQELWHGGKIHRIRSNIVHLMRGEIFDIEDIKFFCFGGAPSHDAQYRVSNVNWWQEELPTLEEMKHAKEKLDEVNWKVDYVLTHEVYQGHPLSSKYETNMNNYGPEYYDLKPFLKEIEEKLDYRIWLHGHYHVDEIHKSPSNKPCITLFDRVITKSEIEKIEGAY